MPFRRSSSEVSRLRLKVTEISRYIVLTDAMVQERAQSPYRNRLKTAHLLCLLLGLLLVSNARAYKPRIRPRMSSAAIPKFLASSRFAVVGVSYREKNAVLWLTGVFEALIFSCMRNRHQRYAASSATRSCGATRRMARQ